MMGSMGMRNGLEHSTAEPHKSRGDDERLHPTCLNLMAARCIKARDLLPGVPLYFMDYRFMDYRNRYSSLIAHPCICLLRTLSPSIPLAALAPPRSLSRLAARRLHTSSSMVVTPTRPPVEPSGPPLSPLALASAAHANSSDSYFSAQAGSRPLPRHRRTSGSSFSKLSEFSLDPPLLDKTDQYAASPDQIDENGVTGVRHVALSVDAR